MENKELVSIIMPAYNASNYIQESIDSVIAQTYSKWELIIVDDGSIDGTSEIIKRNILHESRIKLFYQENGKQGKARNLGLKNAEGEYVAFLDSDDLWMPEKLETQLEEIVRYNADLVFSDSYIFFDDNSINIKSSMNTSNDIFVGKEALDDFLFRNKIPTLTVLARKEKILSVNSFSEKGVIQNAEDYHLWLKMLMDNSVFYGSEKILAAYRVHSKSVTQGDAFAIEQKIEVIYDLFHKYPDFKNRILEALKSELRAQARKYSFNNLEFNHFVKRNCYYLGKQGFVWIFRSITFFFGPVMTCKLLNRTLNGKG